MDGQEIESRRAIDMTQPGAVEPIRVDGERTLVAVEPGAEPLQRFWEAVRRLPGYLKLAANLARDPQVPRSAKGFVVAGGAYAVSPIDLVPGVIPVAGQVDDLLVLLFTLRTAVRSCPAELAEAHLARAGLQATDFDRDIDATKAIALWLMKRGLRASSRIAVSGGRRLGSLAGAAVRRARAAARSSERPPGGDAL